MTQRNLRVRSSSQEGSGFRAVSSATISCQAVIEAMASGQKLSAVRSGLGLHVVYRDGSVGCVSDLLDVVAVGSDDGVTSPECSFSYGNVDDVDVDESTSSYLVSDVPGLSLVHYLDTAPLEEP